MAFKKSFISQQLQHEFPQAYHRLTVNDSQAHYGVLRITAEVFATKAAAAAPPVIPSISTDDDGQPILLPDRTDYVWEQIPSDKRSLAQPIGYYQIELWNRKPQGRKQGDGGSEYIVDAAKFDALMNKGTPIDAPAGTPEREKYNPRAQAYRLVRGLADFADATDDK